MTSLLRRSAVVIASTVVLGLGLPVVPAKAGTTPAKPTANPTAKPAPKTPAAKTPAAKTPAAKTPVQSVPTTPTLASRLAAVKTAKAINYYPSTAGWSRMWSSFDATKIDADMARADALGATGIRAIIFPNTFGYPAPKAEYTARLAKFVTMADAHGLSVKFTLFDWWGAYSDVTGSAAWAGAILKPYVNDKRVISVELQNEFDTSDPAAVAWARKIVPVVRAVAPAMPLTFSVNGTTGAAGMAAIKSMLAATPLDFFDFHFYTSSERALAVIRKAQATVAPAPVVIGEVGLNTLQNTDGEQAAFLARVFQAATVAGVRSVAPWTLTDFAVGAIPESAVGKLQAQYNYGLYRTDGTAKPAAAVVRAAFTGTAYPADLMDNSFEAAAGLTSWRAYLPEVGLAVKTRSAARTGRWSVSIANAGKGASGSPSFRVAPIVPILPGQRWRGEVWARGNAATGITQIALSWFDANDNWLGGAASATLPLGTTNWTKLSAAGSAPAGSASMQIHLKSGDNTGTVWFDDVVMSVS